MFNNAHERELFEDIEDELTEVFEEVLEYTSKLIKIIKTTLNYMQELH